MRTGEPGDIPGNNSTHTLTHALSIHYLAGSLFKHKKTPAPDERMSPGAGVICVWRLTDSVVLQYFHKTAPGFTFFMLFLRTPCSIAD